MNIWIFNHYAVTPDMPGGTRHYKLGRELVRRGYDVTIFASSFAHKQRKETHLFSGNSWRVQNVNGVKFVWIKTFPYQKNDWRRVVNMLSYMIGSYRLGGKITRLDSIIPKPCVVMGSSVHLFAVLSAYFVAKHLKAKFIMEIRDLWSQTIMEMGKMGKKNPIIKILGVLEKFLYRRAERIITLLPLAGDYLSARGINKEKITWIPNGLDLSRFDRIEINEQNEKFKVMYLGAHGQANALDVLLDAAKIVQDNGYKDIKFLLIGDGPMKPKLMRRKDELKLDNVEFCPPVAQQEVPGVLRKADVTVFVLKDMELYRYGISLNKVFDYMASGKPTIMAGSAANNIIQEAQCGHSVPSRDPQALADAVIQLYEVSPEERKTMGDRGRQYVKKHHNLKILVNRLEKCLQDLK